MLNLLHTADTRLRSEERGWGGDPVESSEVVCAGSGPLNCSQDRRTDDHGDERQTDQETEHNASSFSERWVLNYWDWGS